MNTIFFVPIGGAASLPILLARWAGYQSCLSLWWKAKYQITLNPKVIQLQIVYKKKTGMHLKTTLPSNIIFSHFN
jgi:hypothetical protein